MPAPFPYRGFMLDVCRHFMPVEHIEKLIEAAALCGMNRMHWHLTDDQGWRVEIRRWPELTRIGANRGWSYFGPVSGLENNCGFYTQAQVRHIVVFARERGIEIIPEIEIPGHASALLAALPQCGCRAVDDHGRVLERPYRYEVVRAAGIYPNLLCAGREEPLRIVEDILDEIVALFPFPMVHIGGDEAPKLRWRRCPDCQRRMREQGIESEDALQRQLVLDIGEYLAQKGRRTVVWNDVLAGGPLPGHFVVQQWLGDAPLTRAFMEAGGQVSLRRHRRARRLRPPDDPGVRPGAGAKPAGGGVPAVDRVRDQPRPGVLPAAAPHGGGGPAGLGRRQPRLGDL